MDHLHWITVIAQAQGKGGGSAVPGGCGGGMGQLLPILLMFAVFYFLIIRPQQKKQKEHQEMLKNLKRGDDVITSGGIVGKIAGMTDKYLTVEIADKIRIKMLRSHVLAKHVEGSSDDADLAPTSTNSNGT